MPAPRPIRVTSAIKPSSAVASLFDETAEQAKHEGKVPVLTLAAKGKPGFLIVADPVDLGVILAEYRAARAAEAV